MRIVCFFIFGFVLLLLQTTVLYSLTASLGRPDFLFLLIVFCGLRMDIYVGVLLVLLLGLMVDVSSGVFLGMYPILYLLLFGILRGVTKHLVVEDSAQQIALVAICYLLMNAGVMVFSSVFAPETSFSWSWLQIFLQLIVLSLAALPFFYVCEKLLSTLKKWRSTRMMLHGRAGNRFKE